MIAYFNLTSKKGAHAEGRFQAYPYELVAVLVMNCLAVSIKQQLHNWQCMTHSHSPKRDEQPAMQSNDPLPQVLLFHIFLDILNMEKYMVPWEMFYHVRHVLKHMVRIWQHLKQVPACGVCVEMTHYLIRHSTGSAQFSKNQLTWE